MKFFLKKPVLFFIFLSFIFTACLPFNFDPNDPYSRSKENIINKWEYYKPTFTGDPFNTEPNLSAPYTTGELKEGFLEDGVNMGNFVRFLALLPENLILDEDLNEQAQYGAVLLAVSNFSHLPDKPSDMSENFYDNAITSTSTSNLSGGISTLPGTIQEGYMRDDDVGNLPKIGHRRWILNPTLERIGFGFADNSEGTYRYYSTMQVLDQSGEAIDYEYIRWPNAGYFPKEFFDSNDPWSITLNPDKYRIPSIDEITITLRRDSDGTVWTFDEEDNTTPSESGEYLNIDKGNYGVRNCIIFRPDPNEAQSKDADISDSVYEVIVNGVKDTAGYEVEISYTVEFFEMGIDKQEVNAMLSILNNRNTNINTK